MYSYIFFNLKPITNKKPMRIVPTYNTLPPPEYSIEENIS